MPVAENLTQLNIQAPDDVIETVDRLQERYGWSKRDAVMTAIRALSQLMNAHEAVAEGLRDEVAPIYRALAVAMPAAFVELPSSSTRTSPAGARAPFVRVENWLFFLDEVGDLLAREVGGADRVARVVDGEIKPLKMPTDEVALN